MRSAVGRSRGLVVFLALAASAAWALLRRRSTAATRYAAPAWSDAGSEAGRDVPASDAGLVGEPTPAAAAAAPAEAAEAAEAAEPAEAAAPAAEEPGRPGEVPGDVLATDAGLTAEPGPAEPAEPTGPAEPAADLASEAPTAEITAVDDLRALRGIGPTTEGLLHELGITTYRQIAALEGAELERVRAALPEFRSRIEREDWMGQARELHREKYGEAL